MPNRDYNNHGWPARQVDRLNTPADTSQDLVDRQYCSAPLRPLTPAAAVPLRLLPTPTYPADWGPTTPTPALNPYAPDPPQVAILAAIRELTDVVRTLAVSAANTDATPDSAPTDTSNDAPIDDSTDTPTDTVAE